MTEYGLRRDDVEAVEFVFGVYDCDGECNKIDASDLGEVLRALNCNPTLAYIKKLGQTEKRGEKILTIDEFFQIFAEVKKEKEQGCYEDFIECLKLYDKNENGKMMLSDLTYALLALGESLTQDQLDELFTDCMGEENDDGEIEYAPFLAKFCGRA